MEDHIHTHISQAHMWPKEFASLRKVIIMLKSHLKTQARAHVVVWKRDMALRDETRLDYDRRRFQIECHFRDAKP